MTYRTRTYRTYRMKMRVVRSAPYYDTIEVESVEVEATNANAAEAVAVKRMRAEYPESFTDAYAASKRVVAKREVEQ